MAYKYDTKNLPWHFEILTEIKKRRLHIKVIGIPTLSTIALTAARQT